MFAAPRVVSEGGADGERYVGSTTITIDLEALADRHHAVLLANHGPVVAGTTLDAAVNAIEELEETAKLHLLLQGRKTRPLTPAQAADVRQHFPT